MENVTFILAPSNIQTVSRLSSAWAIAMATGVGMVRGCGICAVVHGHLDSHEVIFSVDAISDSH